MIQFPKKIDRELIKDEEGKWLAAKRDLEEAIKAAQGIIGAERRKFMRLKNSIEL